MSSTRGCWFQSMITYNPFAPSSHLMGALNHRCMSVSNCLLMHTGIKKNTKVTLKECTLPVPQKKTFAFLSSKETRPPLYIQVFVSYNHLAKMLPIQHMLLSPLKQILHFPIFYIIQLLYHLETAFVFRWGKPPKTAASTAPISTGLLLITRIDDAMPLLMESLLLLTMKIAIRPHQSVDKTHQTNNMPQHFHRNVQTWGEYNQTWDERNKQGMNATSPLGSHSHVQEELLRSSHHVPAFERSASPDLSIEFVARHTISQIRRGV
jgi:hypothetical protein